MNATRMMPYAATRCVLGSFTCEQGSGVALARSELGAIGSEYKPEPAQAGHLWRKDDEGSHGKAHGGVQGAHDETFGAQLA